MELGNQTDHLALLQFKQLISNDPNGILDSWNSSTHFCKWHGIICSPKHQRVTKLKLEGYKLHGSISPYVGNLSHMRFLDLRNNSFYGNIPEELGRLSRLRHLLLLNNSLVGELPINLTKCSELKRIRLGGNKLIGKIPSQIGSLVRLQYLSMEQNNLTGKVPPSIRNLSSLTIFSVGYNNLVGNIPQEMCFLKQLEIIAVHVNKLSDTFPSCLYNMSSLEMISAPMNNFSGSLPPNMFHTLPNLYFFGISANQISGPIPISITNASSLQLFDISQNHFMGQVPSFGKLQSLLRLSMSINNIGGNSMKDLEFLKSLANCSKLQILSLTSNNFIGRLQNFIDVSENHLSGDIPETIGECISLEYLHLQGNSFNGTIPIHLASLKGEVPTDGVFGNATQVAIIGNNKLCGGISQLHLPPCLIKARNLIGSGGFGSVYRGNLVSEDNVVAVKVLNLQNEGAHKSFIVEYYNGQEFKALVFYYMKNGSLEQWLHPDILTEEQPTLDFGHRLHIIIDVASAIHYLHQECEQLIIHCDLKPSNVLLDEDMVAHVSDFGIARLVSTLSGNTSTIGIKGSVGYAPP
ncbi:LRR receptor-like kinase resistance protein, partial [Trifolium pratense]